MPRGVPIDLAGRRFGLLTAIAPTAARARHYIVWECKCDCGGSRLVDSFRLTSGRVVLCSMRVHGRRASTHRIEGRIALDAIAKLDSGGGLTIGPRELEQLLPPPAAPFDIEYTEDAVSAFVGSAADDPRIRRAAEALAFNPHPTHSLRLREIDHGYAPVHELVVGTFRVIYSVREQPPLVTVLAVVSSAAGPRKPLKAVRSKP